MYLQGDDDILPSDAKNYDDDGFVVSIGWAGAKKSESWQLGPPMVNITMIRGAPTTIAHTMSGAYDEFKREGFKGATWLVLT